MNAAERKQFKALFGKFCRAEMNAGHCAGDTCEFCPIQQAYSEIFKADANDLSEGICPVCGADLEYTSAKEIADDSVKIEWTCPECETEGTEWYNIEFASHEDLLKPDNTEYTEEELAGKNLECGEICPICGGEIDFNGDQDLTADYEGTEVTWHCTKCGTQGTEISDLVFSEHQYTEPENEPTGPEKKIFVGTPLGRLEACIGGDSEYPEIFVYIVRTDGVEIDLVAGTVDLSSNSAKAYLYGDTATEDWTRCHQWSEAEINIDFEEGESK